MSKRTDRAAARLRGVSEVLAQLEARSLAALEARKANLLKEIDQTRSEREGIRAENEQLKEELTELNSLATEAKCLLEDSISAEKAGAGTGDLQWEIGALEDQLKGEKSSLSWDQAERDKTLLSLREAEDKIGIVKPIWSRPLPSAPSSVFEPFSHMPL